MKKPRDTQELDGSSVLDPEYRVPLAAEVAAWIAARYEPGESGPAEAHRGSYPLLYRVPGSYGSRWLRVHSRGWPARERLEAQVEAVSIVHRLGASTVRPVAARDGRFVQALEVGDELRLGVLFTDAPGGAVDPSNVREVAALGSAVARLHGAGVGFDRGALGEIDFNYLAEAALRGLPAHAAADGLLDEVRDTALAMKRAWLAGVPRGLCHGDVHADNANIASDGTVTIFDFDELAHGPLAYDLACYWRKCILGHEHRDAADSEWAAFLDGYEELRPITAEERRAIPCLATLRAIWVMAMPASYVGIWGSDWLTDPTYFAAHLTMIRRFAAEARASE